MLLRRPLPRTLSVILCAMGLSLLLGACDRSSTGGATPPDQETLQTARIVTEFRGDPSDAWAVFDEETYQYDDRGRRVSVKNIRYLGGDPITETRDTLRYTAEGAYEARVSWTKQLRGTDEPFVQNPGDRAIEYDAEGRATVLLFPSDNLNPSSRVTQSYADGRDTFFEPKRAVIERRTSEGWQFITRSTVEDDDAYGYITALRVESWDADAQAWTFTSRREITERDASGQAIRGREITPTDTSEVTYERNANGTVAVVTYAQESTQYRFRYEYVQVPAGADARSTQVPPGKKLRPSAAP